MATVCDIPILEQHAFLELAKNYEWTKVMQQVSARPALAAAQPYGRDGTVRWSALHQAAFGGSADAARFLLRSKAAIDARSSDGKTPLDVARNDAVKAVLREAGAGSNGGVLPSEAPTRPVVAKATRTTKAYDDKKCARSKKTAMRKIVAGMRGRVMKGKPVRTTRSKIAKCKRAKALVYQGRFERTVSGLKFDQLTKNKDGKVVSKKMQARGKAAYSNIEGWIEAFMKARTELGVSGFVVVRKGSPLYAKTMELYRS